MIGAGDARGSWRSLDWRAEGIAASRHDALFGGRDAGVEVGVGVVLDGLSVSLPPQAVKAAIDTKAATPSAAVVLQNRELRILVSDLR